MQQQIDVAPHLEALKKALGSKVGSEVKEDELRDEFAKYLEYGVPVDQAVRTILRHHGVATSPSGNRPAPDAPSGGRTTLADTPRNAGSVHLKVRILSLNEKEVNARGETKKIQWGLLGDESGTASYTSWRLLEGLEKGDVVEVQGAYTKEYNGALQVNFGDRTRFERLEQDALPRAPVQVRDATVAELKDGLRGIRVTGRLLSVQARQVTVQGAPKTLWSGQFADASGKTELTSWHDHKLVAGAAYTIEGGYVRSFRGVPQVNIDQDAKVTPAEGVPSAAELDRAPPTPIGLVVERGGGSDLRIQATLLEVRTGSGLVFRCTAKDDNGACTRVLVAGQCRLHGKVEGTPDLRLKGVLDDGTGAVSLILGREGTEALLGKDLEQCKKEAQAAFRPEVIQDQLKEKLTGRVFTVRGNALSDEYGIMLLARSMVPQDGASIEAEAQWFLASLGAAPSGGA